MKVRTLTAAFFSPTGNTERIVRMLSDEIAQLLHAAGQEISLAEDDFTLPAARREARHFGPDDLVIVGAPTYAGRVPNKIAPEIRKLFHGEGTPVVPVVTFGNRSFDNSLAELADILRENGFVPAGAAAMCMPHAFSDTLGAGRPDEEDKTLLKRLAEAVCFFLTAGEELAGTEEAAGAGAQKISGDLDEFRASQDRDGSRTPENRDAFRILQDRNSLRIPGAPDAPYYTPLGTDGQPAKFLKAVPKVNASLCRHCGTCAAVCPMGSVSAADPAAMTGICIKCQACIRKCPAGARYFDDPAFLSHVKMLEMMYRRRAESAIFT